ncbi:hypothetical protein VTK56DRAFT_7253 [Thermocarpiscus australiensis]
MAENFGTAWDGYDNVFTSNRNSPMPDVAPLAVHDGGNNNLNDLVSAGEGDFWASVARSGPWLQDLRPMAIDNMMATFSERRRWLQLQRNRIEFQLRDLDRMIVFLAAHTAVDDHAPEEQQDLWEGMTETADEGDEVGNLQEPFSYEILPPNTLPDFNEPTEFAPPNNQPPGDAAETGSHGYNVPDPIVLRQQAAVDVLESQTEDEHDEAMRRFLALFTPEPAQPPQTVVHPVQRSYHETADLNAEADVGSSVDTKSSRRPGKRRGSDVDRLQKSKRAKAKAEPGDEGEKARYG